MKAEQASQVLEIGDLMTTSVSRDATTDLSMGERERVRVWAWQQRLLPFTTAFLIALTAFFCLASAYQGWIVQRHIQQTHEIDLKPVFNGLETATLTAGEQLEQARWKTLVVLESHAIQSRYHQASVALMSRVYVIFLGFVTGMVLALVGAMFLLAKLRENESHAELRGLGWQVSLATASPGVVLAILGTALMIITIEARLDINVRDASLYVPPASIGAAREASLDAAPPAREVEPAEKPSARVPTREELLKSLKPGNR